MRPKASTITKSPATSGSTCQAMPRSSGSGEARRAISGSAATSAPTIAVGAPSGWPAAETVSSTATAAKRPAMAAQPPRVRAGWATAPSQTPESARRSVQRSAT